MRVTAPSNVDAERNIITSVLRAPQTLDVLEQILEVEDFYHEPHQDIYKAAKALYERGEAVDEILLQDQLKAMGALERSRATLQTLSTGSANVEAVEGHARVVRDKAVLRRMQWEAVQIAQRCGEDDADAKTVVGEADAFIQQLGQRTISGSMERIQNPLLRAYDRIIEIAESGGKKIPGVPSGYKGLDTITSGFQPADLIILAARPSVGKTALAGNILANVAIDHGIPAAMFSLEMTKEAIALRLMQARARISSDKLRTGSLSEEEWETLNHHMTSIWNAPIYIDDTSSIPVNEVRAKVRKLQRHGVGLIIVDYLQLMKSGNKNLVREQEVSEIARGLKNIAKDSGIPIIALAQLSRGVEKREDKMPILSDLRESGSIEQEADIVMFLHRDNYYGYASKDVQDDSPMTVDPTKLIVAKHRNGPVGKVDIFFERNYARFTEMTRRYERQEEAHYATIA